MPKLPGDIKLYRRLRYRKGHGVHSPFVFNLITKVIEEKSPYYVFDDIEKIRKELLTQDIKNISSYVHKKQKALSISTITAKETQHKKYGALLFRLVNFFKCKHVVHVGAGTGIMSYYLASSQSDCVCIALEEREKLASVAQANAHKFGLKQLQFKSGIYEENLKEILGNSTFPELIFINTSHDPDLTKQLLTTCLGAANNNTILIVDGIKKNKKMIALWKALKQNTKTTVTVDLYALGIVFFNDKIHKRHYKTYFDYGEKQNLYTNRRQRFNVFSWRKKSS